MIVLGTWFDQTGLAVQNQKFGYRKNSKITQTFKAQWWRILYYCAGWIDWTIVLNKESYCLWCLCKWSHLISPQEVADRHLFGCSYFYHLLILTLIMSFAALIRFTKVIKTLKIFNLSYQLSAAMKSSLIYQLSMVN